MRATAKVSEIEIYVDARLSVHLFEIAIEVI